MSENINDTLKPCPFCGSTKHLQFSHKNGAAYLGYRREQGMIRCRKCGTRGPVAHTEEKRRAVGGAYMPNAEVALARLLEDAVNLWNDRAKGGAVC